ncbi:hypothetical protein [Microbacterium rhizophilus]|uniref:hypothetical protein n=1 Tax=Microbacterium rhizophilus TaxID=3138934 RepID=UPI0031E8AB36
MTDRPGSPARRLSPQRILQSVTLALTVVAGLVVLLGPGYTVATADSSGVQTLRSATVLEELGPGAVLIALVPVGLAAMPLLAGPRVRQAVTIAAAILLLAWGVLGALTIGIFYAPATLSAIAAVFVPRHPATSLVRGHA